MERVREKVAREMRSGIYTLLILKALEDLGESYGYGIQKYIEEKTGGKIKLKDATVYPVLRYLTKKKVLEAYWTEPGRGVPRKYYSLTEEGKKLLADIIVDYRTLVKCTDAVLGGDEND